MDIPKILTKQYPFLTPSDIEQLEAIAIFKSFDPNETFIQLGESRRKLGIILKGLIRGYYIQENGNEATLLFAKEGEIASTHELIYYNQPSKQIVETLEPTEMLVFNFDEAEQLAQQNSNINKLQEQYNQHFLIKVLHRLDSFLILTPEDRYLWFLEQYPDLVQRVQQKHFASFLGITPVSLSRIRARVSKKKS